MKDHIARIIEGADQLVVITDRLEEVSVLEVMHLGACAAGEAYRLAAEQLHTEGRNEVAREIFKKAYVCFERGQDTKKARYCLDASIRLYPPNGHIYG